jgi:hypothetical protein
MRGSIRSIRCALAVLSLVAGAAFTAGAGERMMLEQPPQCGLYYDRYEPSFYTGFAPRTYDPRRLHVHLGRGNQLRVTVVLSDEALRDYARDLRERARTYRALVDSGRLELTQNDALEAFERTLAAAELERLVAEEAALSPDALAARNLALLERLNPGRIFRIRIPVAALLQRWAANVRPQDHTHMDPARRVELVNLMLPTRLWVTELDGETSAQLVALVRRCPPAPADPAALEPLRADFARLLGRVTHGIYPERDGVLAFAELTAIYPVGTLNQFTNVLGRPIPEYPTPGRRAFTTHQRTRTIDHVPTDTTYSYFPWLPYMHVGTRLHNAVHTLFWRMRPADTPFLPAEWRRVRDDTGRPYEYLWLLSRGPMSHGCTHLNAGHISELRQLLPAETEQLAQVDVFYNTSTRYDVFDIDGNLEPEVMGVRYFIAYALDRHDKPERLRVRNERRAYYDWLYAGELTFADAEAERGVFASASDCRFVGRSAKPGAQYGQIALYEAPYQPETIQFYRLVDIPFAKALRTVGVRSPFGASPDTVLSAR